MTRDEFDPRNYDPIRASDSFTYRELDNLHPHFGDPQSPHFEPPCFTHECVLIQNEPHLATKDIVMSDFEFTMGPVEYVILGVLLLIAANWVGVLYLGWRSYYPDDGAMAQREGIPFHRNPWNEYVFPARHQRWFEEWCDEFATQIGASCTKPQTTKDKP